MKCVSTQLKEWQIMILLVAAQKGGVGKSTLVVNIAVQLAMTGVDVAIVDTDTQGTCVQFIDRRDEAKIEPRIHCVQRTGKVGATLQELAKRYQVVIVDAGGRDSQELRSAATVADLMLIPTGASQPDLETLPDINAIIETSRVYNPDLKAFAVLTMASPNQLISETRDALDSLEEFDQMERARTVIRSRQIYKQAMRDGLGVVETSNWPSQG
jgi:chromosome partitioning protein